MISSVKKVAWGHQKAKTGKGSPEGGEKTFELEPEEKGIKCFRVGNSDSGQKSWGEKKTGAMDGHAQRKGKVS